MHIADHHYANRVSLAGGGVTQRRLGRFWLLLKLFLSCLDFFFRSHFWCRIGVLGFEIQNMLGLQGCVEGGMLPPPFALPSTPSTFSRPHTLPTALRTLPPNLYFLPAVPLSSTFRSLLFHPPFPALRPFTPFSSTLHSLLLELSILHSPSFHFPLSTPRPSTLSVRSRREPSATM